MAKHTIFVFGFISDTKDRHGMLSIILLAVVMSLQMSAPTLISEDVIFLNSSIGGVSPKWWNETIGFTPISVNSLTIALALGGFNCMSSYERPCCAASNS